MSVCVNDLKKVKAKSIYTVIRVWHNRKFKQSPAQTLDLALSPGDRVDRTLGSEPENLSLRPEFMTLTMSPWITASWRLRFPLLC